MSTISNVIGSDHDLEEDEFLIPEAVTAESTQSGFFAKATKAVVLATSVVLASANPAEAGDKVEKPTADLKAGFEYANTPNELYNLDFHRRALWAQSENNLFQTFIKSPACPLKISTPEDVTKDNLSILLATYADFVEGLPEKTTNNSYLEKNHYLQNLPINLDFYPGTTLKIECKIVKQLPLNAVLSIVRDYSNGSPKIVLAESCGVSSDQVSAIGVGFSITDTKAFHNLQDASENQLKNKPNQPAVANR